jgi:hypothetical protein
MTTPSHRQVDRSTPRTLLAAVVLSLGLLGGLGASAAATMPTVVPHYDTGGSGGGSIVAGVQQAPREEICPVCRLPE